MAPKRPLYGDLNSAHAGIMRRVEDAESNLDLPLPPTPAALSPNSSSYTSPPYSPDSVNAPPPLAIRKPMNDSRFSLKQLTRSLTKKLGKSPAKNDDEELQDMREHESGANYDYPRTMDRAYAPTLQTAYSPVHPKSPITPTSPSSPLGYLESSPPDSEAEYSPRYSADIDNREALTSLIPDEPSPEVGRQGDRPISSSEPGPLSKPYYDDLESIYASSSVYTGDDRHRSHRHHSHASHHQSNPFLRYSGMDASGLASEYNQDRLYDYSNARRPSRQALRPLTQEMYHRSIDQGDTKTDTISKIIDEYSPTDIRDNSVHFGPNAMASRGSTTERDVSGDAFSIDRPRPVRVTSGLSQFEFDIHQEGARDTQEPVREMQPVLTRRPTITRDAGMPPREPLPLAPAFGYESAPFNPAQPDMSALFTDASYYSYGDTRHLLQTPQTSLPPPARLGHGLESSSAYSQPEMKMLEPSSSYSQESPHSPQTPQEALDQAEQIFQDVVDEHQRNEDAIPAMWTKRSSGSLLFSKKLADNESDGNRDSGSSNARTTMRLPAEKADWETIRGNSLEGRESLDSIADYSSSDESRNSLGVASDGTLPSWVKKDHSRGPSLYSHPSPVRDRHQPFNSSPPQLRPRSCVRTAPEASSSPLTSSPPVSKTTPAFRLSARNEGVIGRGAVEEPYVNTPWADRYAFSDKETQELLASGPNDKIIIEDETDESAQLEYEQETRKQDLTSSPPSMFSSSPVGLERENTFEKLSMVGPKGNLTGTPRGSGMHETGSSVADNSSPGIRLSSSVDRRNSYARYTDFYASPFPATGSVTRISQTRQNSEPEQERTPSQITLFPGANTAEAIDDSPQSPSTNNRRSLHGSTTFQQARRTSRSAVPGQTKLRQMFLATDGRTTISSQDTHFSKFLPGGDRPSTSDTNTPLRPSHPSIDIFPPSTTRGLIAHEHSPHLLCPERQLNAEDEARRRKLSWYILAAFCLLPPCIILFRVWGDSIMISLTEGRLGYCTAKSKKVAVAAAVVVNLGLVAAILVPVLVVNALKGV